MTRPDSGPTGEGWPMVFARNLTAAVTMAADAGDAPLSCSRVRYSASCAVVEAREVSPFFP